MTSLDVQHILQAFDLHQVLASPAGIRNREEILRQIGKDAAPARLKSSTGETHSEEDFFAMLTERGLPIPETEYNFTSKFNSAGQPRKWRSDYYWDKPAYLAIEVQGGIHMRKGRHSGGEGQINDMEKFNECAVEGIRILYATPTSLCSPEFIETVYEAFYGGNYEID